MKPFNKIWKISLELLILVLFLAGTTQEPAYSQKAPTALTSRVTLPLIFSNYGDTQTPLLTWVRLDKNLPLDWIRDIAINPVNQDILVSHRNYGLYKSSDLGVTWREVYGMTQDSTPNTRLIEYSVVQPDIVYATIMNSVLKSIDGGETWSSIFPKDIIGGGWALAVDPTDPDHVFIGINTNTPYHIYETQDGGTTWEPKNLSLPEDEGVISIAFDPDDTQILFAGANTDVAAHPEYSRLYVSNDGGDTWELIGDEFPNTKRVTSIKFNHCTDNIFVSRQKHGLVDQYIRSSDDGGITWDSAPLTDDDIEISPQTPCPTFTALHRNLNQGLGWEDISYNFYSLIQPGEVVRFSSWAADPINDILWLGTREHGIYFIRGVVPAE